MNEKHDKDQTGDLLRAAIEDRICLYQDHKWMGSFCHDCSKRVGNSRYFAGWIVRLRTSLSESKKREEELAAMCKGLAATVVGETDLLGQLGKHIQNPVIAEAILEATEKAKIFLESTGPEAIQRLRTEILLEAAAEAGKERLMFLTHEDVEEGAVDMGRDWPPLKIRKQMRNEIVQALEKMAK